MKKLLFTFLLISAFFSAQNRFIYDYKFVTDSTNKADVKSELMYLDISEKTGASTATISRVNRSLNYGNDGYEMVFSRMAEKETKGE